MAVTRSFIREWFPSIVLCYAVSAPWFWSTLHRASHTQWWTATGRLVQEASFLSLLQTAQRLPSLVPDEGVKAQVSRNKTSLARLFLVHPIRRPRVSMLLIFGSGFLVDGGTIPSRHPWWPSLLPPAYTYGGNRFTRASLLPNPHQSIDRVGAPVLRGCFACLRNNCYSRPLIKVTHIIRCGHTSPMVFRKKYTNNTQESSLLLMVSNTFLREDLV